MTMLEELEIQQGNVDLKGSVFYVTQEPWIFTSSIKQNILFGKPYDPQKFKEIVDVCCLKQVNNLILLI